MSGDVRSLEEVIAAAELEWLASVKGSQSETRAEWIAAAVREWCLAPQQVQTAYRVVAEQRINRHATSLSTALAVLRAVMGEAP